MAIVLYQFVLKFVLRGRMENAYETYPAPTALLVIFEMHYPMALPLDQSIGRGKVYEQLSDELPLFYTRSTSISSR